MTYLIIILFSLNAQASDDWLCKEASSVQRGNSIYACGISQGHTEQEARESAFYAAENEFRRIHVSMEKVEVEAKRTECEPIPEVKDSFMPGANYFQFKCYRLVVFTLPE
jgi:hypothetical protein